MKALVIAPHPDDEILGCGGTMHRLISQGDHVEVVVCTKGWPPLFDDAQVQAVREHAKKANDQIGVRKLSFLDLPVTKLNTLPKHEINDVFAKLLARTQPDWLFLPHRGDRHEDHRQVFDACLVAARPQPTGHRIARILAYETISESHWTAPGIEPPFVPNVHIDITKHIAAKLDAFRRYQNQTHGFPHPRSVEGLEALARFRGSVIGVEAAEAFMLVRELF